MEYGGQLKDIEDALGDSVNDAWDMTLDPISLQVLFQPGLSFEASSHYTIELVLLLVTFYFFVIQN